MGLSIHYNGKFNDEASLLDLIEEAKDVAETFNWEYVTYKNQFPLQDSKDVENDKNIYGISLMPPNCEPIELCFLANRRMSAEHLLNFWGNTKEGLENKYLYLISTKTQFAGITTHKIIIKLFRHLFKSGYFKEFEMFDEGGYWETDNEGTLEVNFKRYNALIDNFSLALETIPKETDETFEDYIERVFKKISKNNNK